MTWRPIETAPKTGEIIDLWVMDSHRDSSFRIADCFWGTGAVGGGLSWVYNADGGRDEVESADRRVTHWMLTPPSPADELQRYLVIQMIEENRK